VREFQVRDFAAGDLIPPDVEIVHVLNVDRFTKRVRALILVPFKLESLEEEE
jgi:hypothetical protein